MAPTVTVIVPFRSAGPYLDECLAYLAAQTFRDFDVILVPEVPFALPEVRAGVRLIAAGDVLPNRKRQIAALQTHAPILAFIDDDAYPDPYWLERAVRHFRDPHVVAAGGPGVTPPNDPPNLRTSGAIFASALVTAGARYRYRPTKLRDVELLPTCNLLVRRDAFLRHVEKTLAMSPGEDTLLCRTLRQDGGRIVYDPEAAVFHHRRAARGHLRQVWSYGFFRGYFFRRIGREPRYAVFAVPVVFVLAHALLPIALVNRRARTAMLAASCAYSALVAISAEHEARTERVPPLPVALGIYLTHLTYGAATIAGWFGDRAR